jgi:hypothetical protein
MAGQGWREWVAGEQLTDEKMQQFLMDQAVMRFANASARDTALSEVLSEGMVAYLDDINTVEVYDGSEWTELTGDPDIFTQGTAGQYLQSNGTAGVDWADIDSASPEVEGLVFGSTNAQSFQGSSFVTLGYQAGKSCTGRPNIFIGSAAGFNATIGTNNLMIGDWAGIQMTSPSNNTGVGHRALSDITTGTNNTALGNGALSNTNASFRVGIGSLVGGNGMGEGNTVIGYSANLSFDAAAATNNTIIGRQAGNLESGSNNTIIGYLAGASSSSVSNQITLGNSNITSLRCNVTSISSLSDERDKNQIEDLPVGLDLINQLRPVKFNWNTRVPETVVGPDGSKLEFSESDVRRDVLDIGFIAQDLVAVEDNLEAHDWLQLTLRDNPDRLEATQGRLIPILVKAIQELSAEIETLKAQVAK